MINKDELSKKISALIEKIPSIELLLEFVVVFGDIFKLVAQLEEQVKSAKDNTTFWYDNAKILREKNFDLEKELAAKDIQLKGVTESCNIWAEKARARYDEVVQKEGQLAVTIQQLDEANEKIAKQQEVVRAQSGQVGFWHNEVAVVQSLVEKERSNTAYWKMMYDGEKAGAVKLNQVIDDLSDRNDRLNALLAKRNFTYNFSSKYVYFP